MQNIVENEMKKTNDNQKTFNDWNMPHKNVYDRNGKIMM